VAVKESLFFYAGLLKIVGSNSFDQLRDPGNRLDETLLVE